MYQESCRDASYCRKDSYSGDYFCARKDCVVDPMASSPQYLKHGDRNCFGNGTVSIKKYMWECNDGTWEFVQKLATSSACKNAL